MNRHNTEGATMTQHTPTLWKVTMDKDKAYIDHNHGLAEDYWTIAQAFGPQQQANAEFIVRACNSHDVLLAALKLAQEAFADLADVAGDVQEWNCGGIGYTASQAVKQAIAQAEGRP